MRRERFVWIGIVSVILLAGILWAAETAPAIWVSSTGQLLHMLDSAGYVRNLGARIQNQSGSWKVADSSGNEKASIHDSGLAIFLDSAGYRNMPADGALFTTVTLTTRQPDPNYFVLLTSEGVTTTSNSTPTFHVSNKSQTGFRIINHAGCNSSVTVSYFVFRVNEP